MEKRLKSYLAYLKTQKYGQLSAEQADSLKEDLLIQIGFFQHERLIHLLVTVTFAILTFLTMFFGLTYDSFTCYILLALFLILLVPYIRHYYILENGVQKLYQYYDKLKL